MQIVKTLAAGLACILVPCESTFPQEPSLEFGLDAFELLSAVELSEQQQGEIEQLLAVYAPKIEAAEKVAARTDEQRAARSKAIQQALERGLKGAAARDHIAPSGQLAKAQIAAQREAFKLRLALDQAVRSLLTGKQLSDLPSHGGDGHKPGGYIIVRLSPKLPQPSSRAQTLAAVAAELKLAKLSALLSELHITSSRRVVRGITYEDATAPRRPDQAKLMGRLRSYWKVDARKYADQMQMVLDRFNRLPEVDSAYHEFTFSDPMADPSDDAYSDLQGYLDPAPVGIDARFAWTQSNGEGALVGFADLERGWHERHEDLIDKWPLLIYGDERPGSQRHGTAVLGEVVATDNLVGVVGIAPSTSYVFMTSYFDAATMSDSDVAEAIYRALPFLFCGDVLLLEVQEEKDFLPAEVDDAVFDAIQLAVALDIIVVAAAGNGGHDLDAYKNASNERIFDRSSHDFRDSGAIMVGAADSAVPHERTSWSNYGSRIDCYGWGRHVVSTGHKGDLDDGGGDVNKAYTGSFNGTSSAAPIIAGAAIIVQGISKANSGIHIAPGEMRNILSAPGTGTPQSPAVGGQIGVMPDLRDIITAHGGFHSRPIPGPPRPHSPTPANER